MSVTVKMRGDTIDRNIHSAWSRFQPSQNRQKEYNSALAMFSMHCFTSGLEPCVEELDRTFLKRQAIKRDEIVENRRYHWECVETLPVHLRSLIFSTNAVDMRDIYAGEGYVRCLEIHITKMMHIINDECKLVAKELRTIKEQYGIKV